MKFYTVHLPENQENGIQEVMLVPEGFSLLAAIFQGFWALYYRMWWGAGILFSIEIGVNLLRHYNIISPVTAGILNVCVTIGVGFFAWDWKRRHLEKKGYVTTSVVTGRDKEEAERRFLEAYTQPPIAR